MWELKTDEEVRSTIKGDLGCQRFGEGHIQAYFCPGRVNLIGEHIDYNGGPVLPAALTRGVYGAIRVCPESGDQITLRSKNVSDSLVTVNLHEPIECDPADGWANYPKGVVKYLLAEGCRLGGCDIVFDSTLPPEAGLSSSAALEVLTAYMLVHRQIRQKIDRVWLARLCQRVENEFVGVNCGIMDQFAVAMGKADNAMLLDCATLEHRYVPINLKGHTLVIMNTNKRRGLADSKYNERRDECERALDTIRAHRPVENLCAAVLEDVELINNPVLKKRARHVVTEAGRVRKAIEALSANELVAFGRLLTESHTSLRDDYEVTGTHLDAIVTAALRGPGCLGARMTGAGFGGCAIALVKTTSLNAFERAVSSEYKVATGLDPDFYRSEIGDGVRKVKATTCRN